MKSKGRLFNSLRNIGVGFICQLVVMIFSFSTRTIFVRLLGAEYTGVSGLFSNILTLLSLAELGIGNVLIFSLYAPLRDNNHVMICQYIRYFRKLYNRIAVVILFLGLLAIPCLPWIIGDSMLPMEEIRKYYVLYLLNTIFSYIAVDKITLIQADQKVYVKTLTNTIASIVMHICMIVLLIFKKSFTGYLIIQLAFNLGQNIFLNQIVKRMYPYLKEKTDKLAPEFGKKILQNIKATFLYKLSAVIINYTDNILISVLLGVTMVGYYSNYALIMTYVMYFIGYITTGVAGSLGNYNAESNASKSFQMFKNLLFLYSGITVFCTACYLNIVQEFIAFVFGEQYIMSYLTVAAILFSFYVTHAIQPVVMYSESMGMFVQIKYALVATAILNVILSIVLGKIFGVAGIIFATGISRLLTVAWYEPIILFKQKFNQSVMQYWKIQAKNLVINIIIIAGSFSICTLLPDNIIWSLIKLIITVLVFVIVEFITMHKTDEFKWLWNSVKRILIRKP